MSLVEIEIEPHVVTGRQPARIPSPTEAQCNAGGALRAAVFGVNDGLVSNLALMMGVAGATRSNSLALLAGVAGLLSGACSMGAGEWVSVRAQRDFDDREIDVGQDEQCATSEAQHRELSVARCPTASAAERTNAGNRNGASSPWVAAGSSFGAFALGGFIPILPFLAMSGTAAVVAAAFVSAFALFAVGAVVATFTGRGRARGGMRMLGVAALAFAITSLATMFLGGGVA